MSDCLRISVVTVTFNSVATIRATLESVLSQKYSNLQYIVIDGGSTDGTVEILREYSDQLSVLVSEPDRGQYHALSKGFELADGEIFCWLNGDDLYLPWTFRLVDRLFREQLDVEWLIGLHSFANADGDLYRTSQLAACPQRWIRAGLFTEKAFGFLQQESMFWRRRLWERSDGLDLSYSLAADFQLWLQFAKFSELVPVSVPLAQFRVSPGLQRSSKLRTTYNAEVQRAVTEVAEGSRVLATFLEPLSRELRSMIRLLIWPKSKALAYSLTDTKWLLTSTRLPISRSSFATMLYEFLAGSNH
jgi:hypothetical protein